MHTTTMKACLFGGTLLAAGLGAEARADPTIDFSLTTAYVRAYDLGTGQSDWDFFNSSGFFLVSASAGDQAASVEGASSFLSLHSQSAGAGGAYALAVQSTFTVTGDTTAVVKWDFSGETRWDAGAFIIVDTDTNLELINVDFNSANPGHQPISLLAGGHYRATGYAYATDGGGESYVTLAIPTPGSVALLGAGGLLTARRRRS